MKNQTKSTNPLSRLSKNRRRLLIATIVLMFAIMYAIIPQLSFFGQAKRVLDDTNWSYVGLATLFFAGSLVAAALVYRLLVGPKVRLWPALVVQTAGSFAGKIIPLGIGSISLSYLYLRKLKLTPGAATSTVAANNLLGMFGHICLLGLLLAIAPVDSFRLHVDVRQLVTVAVVATLVVIVLISFTRAKRFRIVRDFSVQFGYLFKRPRALTIALLCSMTITACMVAALYCSAIAAGTHIGAAAALVVLSAGLLAQSATPTPGGLGGVEAGLTGGLLLVGVQLDSAIATTLLFRFVTYWVPLIVGGFALALAIRQKYVA